MRFVPGAGIWIARTVFLRATFFFTIVSALHYVILVQQRLRDHTHALPPARNPADLSMSLVVILSKRFFAP